MPEPVFPAATAALPVRLVLYLPTEPSAARVPAADLEAAVMRILCERFGGVTAYPARGTFMLASGTPETEPVTVLEIYAEREVWRVNRDGVARLARLIAHLLHQESLGCSLDGRMLLISADHSEHPPDEHEDLEVRLRRALAST